MTRCIEFLAWDSQFFHRRIARLRASVLSEALVHRAFKQCAEERIDCLYFLSRRDESTLRIAKKYKFQLVDTRQTYRLHLRKRPFRLLTAPPIHFRRAASKDKAALQRIVCGAAVRSRFKMDRHFPPDASRRLYKEWIAKSIRGRFDDEVWIAEVSKSIGGCVSVRKMSSMRGEIGLIAVAERFRRMRVGTALLSKAANWFRQKKVKIAYVATQSENHPAKKLYEKCGYRPAKTEAWYHKWF